MKKQFLFLVLFVSSFGFSQSINDYKAVIVPLKFDFLKSENQYRLSTISKFNLNKAGFKVYYLNEALSLENKERCAVLNYDLVKVNAFMMTKLYIVFKDCFGKIIFQSKIGETREKDFELAYVEALNRAFESVYALKYKSNEKENIITESTPIQKNEVTKPQEVLYAQPIAEGFQLVDSKPSVVMKLSKTSDKDSFLAQKGNIQGVLINKDNQWLFEYYQNNQLISEKLNVKF